MKTTIRDARFEDAASIVQLISEHASLSNDKSPLTANYVAHYLASAVSTILLAEIQSQVVGLLSYSLRPDLYHAGSSCLIEELIVKAEARDQGIGTALMNEMLARLADSECVEISVAVMPDNSRAIHFYRSHGLSDEALFLEMHLCR